MKQYELMHFSADEYLELRCSEDDICFDVPIKIFLCCGNDEYMLLDDILGYALAELRVHFYRMDSSELIPELLEMEIGKAQNENYYRCAHGLPLDLPAIIEVDDMWIGNKYNCFESKDFSTWVYSIRGQGYLKVTPLYSGNYEEEPEISYDDFLQNYEIIFEKSLRQKEVIQCQCMIKKLERMMSIKDSAILIESIDYIEKQIEQRNKQWFVPDRVDGR